MKTSKLASKNGGIKTLRKISVVPMITATYFMVAGGPYGLEDIVQKTGYTATLLILVITPLLWSLPTALMVSELATAIPKEGGFYIWVRRAMGRFWGFQETWLTLAGSMFEMALYPNLCVAYIGRFAPGLVSGWRGLGVAQRRIARAIHRPDCFCHRKRQSWRGCGNTIEARRSVGRRLNRH